MQPPDSPPSILLAEDDRASAAFLIDATAALPAQVEWAASARETLLLARSRRHALWLIDARLPDDGGGALLARLRREGMRTPALAHTADSDRQVHAQLRAEGFLSVLVKPTSAATWQQTLRRALIGSTDASAATPMPPNRPTPDAHALPLWDDAAAAKALGGGPERIVPLRRLFLAELPAQREAIRAGTASRREALHRLRAGCALVGAARLGALAEQLHTTPSPRALDTLLATIAAMTDHASRTRH